MNMMMATGFVGLASNSWMWMVLWELESFAAQICATELTRQFAVKV